MARLSQSWTMDACAKNPITRILNAQGQPTGNIRTCPVRLSYPNIFSPGKPNDKGESKFGSSLLFPKGVDMSILADEANRIVIEKVPGAQRDQYGRPLGIHLPFRDQGEKPGQEGYEVGAVFFNVSSKFKPQVVDSRLNPIVEESRIYPGVWAICSINAYWFNEQGKKKGVSFGLQSVMIVADDEKLGGGTSSAADDFAGVAITASTDIAASFGIGQGAPGAALAVLPVTAIPAAPGAMQPGYAPGFAQPGQPGYVDVNDLF